MNSTAKTRPAETLVSLPPAPSGSGVDILALTEDDLFLLTVRKVVKLPNRIWHATSDTQAADTLMSSPCATVLVDVALMQSQLPTTIKRLRQQFPDMAFVVAGEAEDEAGIAPLIRNGDVQSFIVKQHAARQLASSLQTGIDRHFELNANTPPNQSAGGRGRSTAMVGITAGIVAAIVLVAGAVWVMTNGKQDTAAPPTMDVVAQPATATTSPAVEQALEKARESFAAGRYAEPGDSNDALDHFRAALALEPVNAEAKDGLSRITEIMLARTELALVEGNMRQAAEHLKSAKAIEPSNPRISFLEMQISRESARTASAQQEAERIQELNRKLEALSKAPVPTPAPPPAAQAKAPPPVIEPVVEARKPVETPAPTPAPQVTPADIQAQLLAKAQPLKESMIRKHVEPVYPSRARRDGTEGYVELNLTVSKQGDVSDVRVVGAQPQGLFDQAAVNAARRWKIEPKKIDGETYEQLLAVRLRFRLEQ